MKLKKESNGGVRIKRHIRNLIFCLMLICSLFVVADVKAEEMNNTGYERIKVRHETENNTYDMEFIYSDEMLLKDARKKSPELAKVSIALAAGAYDQESITNTLKDMKYTLRSQKAYDKKFSIWNNDHVAYTISSKNVEGNDGKEYIIYSVVVRGTSKNSEWYSNFNMGKTGDHEGFYKAADEVMDDLQEILKKDYGKNRIPVVWVTGHSRGAAVANVIAGKLTLKYAGNNSDPNVLKPQHIFGYTYACPNVSKNAQESCQNIYNFNKLSANTKNCRFFFNFFFTYFYNILHFSF